jgi:hypothetical protein
MENLQVKMKNYVLSDVLVSGKVYPAVRITGGFNNPADVLSIVCEDGKERMFSITQFDIVGGGNGNL